MQHQSDRAIVWIFIQVNFPRCLHQKAWQAPNHELSIRVNQGNEPAFWKNTCNPSQAMWWAPCRRCNPLIQLFQALSLSFVPCLFGCCKVRGRGDHVFRRVRKKNICKVKISRSIRNFLDTAIRIKTAYSPVSLYIADIDRFCKLRCRRGAQYVGKQTVNCVATTSGTKSLSMVTLIKEVGNSWILLN